ncbi:MAG TPA: hypothetical protein VEY71_10875, partial [Chitinophagales bacterium]|nr:hypothetical protein [Chitinophagales bacterium]
MISIRIRLAFAAALLFPSLAMAQGEANWWFFGTNAGVSFASGSPVGVVGAMSQSEGVASISDASGNLLFYTSGIDVWNKFDVQMPNGFGLWGDPSSTQSGVIVQKPGSTTEYYLFTCAAQAGGTFTSSTYDGVAYSIVDMTLDGGNGDVVAASKNTPLLASTAEKLTAVRHCNGVDVWIIMHKWESDAFYAFLLTASGVDPVPVISNIGPLYTNAAGTGSNEETIGYLKASPQGDKLASCVWYVENNDVELYDFDKMTGVVSNYTPLPTGGWAYGASFSPDGTKLYASFIDVNGWLPYSIVQWDLSAPNPASTMTIIDPNVVYMGAMQLGPDGKIYVSEGAASSLHVINNPN